MITYLCVYENMSTIPPINHRMGINVNLRGLKASDTDRHS